VAGNIEDEVFEALSNKLRRDIIVLLHDRIELTQKELMDYLGVSSGLLNFHLRKLGGPC
jgi:predicted transcriptional regulator